MTSIDKLEAKCRRLIGTKREDRADPGALIEQEIAITLDQLDGVRAKGKQLERRLNDLEMDFKSQILNLSTPRAEYSFDRWAAREKMKQGLGHTIVKLENHQQRLSLDEEKTIRSLQDRLLELWGRWEQIGV